MPRVTHVQHARKDNPVQKKGGSYYWWKFRYGGKRYSLTRPRPSQLTQSNYYSTVRSWVEQIEDTTVENFESFESLRDELLSSVQELMSETQDSLDNIPEQLQEAPTGELLQERIYALENAESEIESIDEPDENEEFEREEYEPEEYDREEYDREEFVAGIDDSAEETFDAEKAFDAKQDKLESDHEDEQDELESAHEDEQHDLESDHEEEQNDLETAHEDDQGEAFENWIEDAMSQLTDAVAETEV